MNTGARIRTELRLAAILAADIAGYSRLIGAEEESTLQRLRSVRAEEIDPKIANHRVRLVKTTGIGLAHRIRRRCHRRKPGRIAVPQVPARCFGCFPDSRKALNPVPRN